MTQKTHFLQVKHLLCPHEPSPYKAKLTERPTCCPVCWYIAGSSQNNADVFVMWPGSQSSLSRKPSSVWQLRPLWSVAGGRWGSLSVLSQVNRPQHAQNHAIRRNLTEQHLVLHASLCRSSGPARVQPGRSQELGRVFNLCEHPPGAWRIHPGVGKTA